MITWSAPHLLLATLNITGLVEFNNFNIAVQKYSFLLDIRMLVHNDVK